MDLNDIQFDANDNVIPQGDSGSATPPASAETTAVAAPSPTPEAKPEGKPAVVEDKSGDAKLPESKAEGDKPDELDTEEVAAKTKHGDSWAIKEFRAAKAELKKLAPAREALTNVGSPERLGQGLEIVQMLADPLQPIAQAYEKMTALSESRTIELRNHIYTDIMERFPDQVASHLLGNDITLDEVVKAVNQYRTGGQAQPAPTDTKPVIDLSGLDLQGMEEDYPGVPAMLKTMADKLGELTAKPAATADDPAKPLREELEGLKKREQDAKIQAVVSEVEAEGQKLYADAYSVVGDGLRELGLAPDPKDDAEVKELKERTWKAIEKDVEPAFDADPENVKLAERIMKHLANRDFKAARAYDEILKVRVDLAFQAASKHHMDLYNAKRLQSSAPTNSAQHRRPEVSGATVTAAGKGDPYANIPAGMTKAQYLQQFLES